MKTTEAPLPGFLTSGELDSIDFRNESVSRTQGAQYAGLKELRDSLKPSHVNIGNAPEWLRSLILGKVGGSNSQSDESLIRNAIKKFCKYDGWLDHWGATVSHGRPLFVAEPYDGTSTSLKEAISFADGLGIEFSVEANSEWYPGWTLRYVFKPKA